MNANRKLLILGAAAAVAVAGLVSTASARNGWGRGGHHDRSGGATALLETYDTNKDGTITQAEVDTVRKDRFARFDANGDGKMSLDEFQGLWLEAMRRRMVAGFQALDADGDASITLDEYQKPAARLIRRFDVNGDGAVDSAELSRGRPDRPDRFRR